jgi:hypothetical protein
MKSKIIDFEFEVHLHDSDKILELKQGAVCEHLARRAVYSQVRLMNGNKPVFIKKIVKIEKPATKKNDLEK